VLLPKRRRTIAAGSVRRELLRAVARRGRGRRSRDGCRFRSRFGRRGWGWSGQRGRLRRSRPTGALGPRLAGDHDFGRSDLAAWRAPFDVRLGKWRIGGLGCRRLRRRDRPRQSHVSFQRRRLGWAQEVRQRPQRKQGKSASPRQLRHPGPANSNSAHLCLRRGGAKLSPLRPRSAPLRCPATGRRPSRPGCGRR
jgi:hypothetical protein